MNENPYAAPSSTVTGVRPTQGTTGRIDLGRCFTDAWNATVSNLGLLIAASLVAMVMFFASVAPVLLGVVFLLPPFTWGVAQFGLNLIDRRGELSDMFGGFGNYWSNLGNMLLLAFLLTLIFLSFSVVYYAGLASGSDALAIGGWLFNQLLVMFVGARLYPALGYMVERGLSAPDSIAAAWRATSGQALTVGLVYLVSTLVALSGLLLLLVGALVTVPMSYLMWASAYRQLAGDPVRRRGRRPRARNVDDDADEPEVVARDDRVGER
ncbi:MAG: hypothetical protein H6837_03100 [Planctomycetes bacterium]|nr:hypothetical protein [Planctomycetota bacterium]